MSVTSNESSATVAGRDSSPGKHRSPVISLHVLRGLTQFPLRPFPIGRFLIGGGEDCDLQLGGAGMPELHSILLADGEGAVLEAVARTPQLQVNGHACQTARLHAGDVIAIGCFQFSVEAPTLDSSSAWIAKRPAATTNSTNVPCDDDEIALRSAVELVELIESEIHRIEDDQSRRSLGARALLEAALERAGHRDNADEVTDGHFAEQPGEASGTDQLWPTACVTDPGLNLEVERDVSQELVDDIDEVIARLDGYSEQLEQRSQRLVEQEAGYMTASTELLKAQQRLADHLELLQKQIESIEPTRPDSLRASA
jgi:hypothetical protein